MIDERFARTARLIGDDGVEKLVRCRIALFGVGGVGSFVGEALARSGVGAIDIFDNDRVDITNINRQLIALTSTVGEPKTAVMAKRMRDINPKISVGEYRVFITPDEAEKIDFSNYDYVIDAIDNVTAKIAICRFAREKGVPVISAMGAGNKLDPTKFQIAPVEKTSVCPLAKVMRLELKKRDIKGVKALFSTEPAIKQSGEGRPSPASIAYVPSVAGLIIAGEVIKDLLGKDNEI